AVSESDLALALAGQGGAGIGQRQRLGELGAFAGKRRKTGGLIQLVEIFPHRTRDVGRIVPRAWRVPIFGAPRNARVSFNHARIRSESLAANQAGAQAGMDDALEDKPEGIAGAKAAMPRFREARSFGHITFKAEAAKPTIGQIEGNLLDEPPFRADAV